MAAVAARAQQGQDAACPAPDGDEYWIDVATVADPVRDCFVATVVVLRLPGMHEVYREEFAAGGGLQRARRRDVVAAALASGQRAVRREQCRQGPA